MNMIWLHGWGTNAKVWGQLPEQFPEYRHFFPSFKRVKAPLEFKKEVVKYLSGEKVILVGWSMGGMLAIESAFQLPDYMTKLIAINTTVRFISSDSRLGWPQRIVQRMTNKLDISPEQCLSDFLDSMFSPHDNDIDLSYTFKHQVFQNEFIATSDFTINGLKAGLDYLANADLTKEGKNLQIPTLWIHGADDPICPIGGFVNLRQALSANRHHQFKIIPHTGHVPFFRFPKDMALIIKDFLREESH